MPSSASASTAANTTITNIATVNYTDAGGNAQTPVTATATVLVILVPSAPQLTSPPAISTSQGSTSTLTYNITGTANGQDTYNLSSTVTPTNDSGGTVTMQASITLGGTTLAAPAVAGQTSILAPYDGNGAATLNGLGVGSTIVIGSNVYTIASITKNVALNTATIGLIGTGITGATVAAGQIVGETKSFVESITSGTVASGNSGTQSVSTTATSTGTGTPSTTQGTATVITVTRPTLTVTKSVSTDNGSTFSASGTATPGTVLLYKIVATNGAGSASATAVSFSDVVPQFLTYVTGSGKYATSTATAYLALPAGNTLVEGTGGYAFNTVTSGAVTYAPGSPGVGTVAGGAVLVLYFKATIN